MREGLTPKQFQQIQWILVDVDGVLTDGGIILGNQGFQCKRFSSRDGHALTLAKSVGFKIGILTGRVSDAVTRRSQELQMDLCYQGESDKLKGYQKLKQAYSFEDHQVAYIGDDYQDAPVLKQVAFAGTPDDGSSELDQVCHLRTKALGGHGAVKEFVEFLIKAKGQWPEVLNRFGLNT